MDGMGLRRRFARVNHPRPVTGNAKSVGSFILPSPNVRGATDRAPSNRRFHGGAAMLFSAASMRLLLSRTLRGGSCLLGLTLLLVGSVLAAPAKQKLADPRQPKLANNTLRTPEFESLP